MISLRMPRSGDFGWIVERHGTIYRDEFDWDEEFEGLVARIVADYVQTRSDPHQAMWIAEVDGERAGCVLCARKDDVTAQLRILLVDPAFRGRGVGERLVAECVRFAREAGYERITLWTNDVLHAARRIYEGAGFALMSSEPHQSFGHNLVGQNWELEL